MVERRDYDHVAVLRFENPSRNRIPGVQTGSRRADRAFAKTQRFDAGLVIVEVGIEERQIQVLPETGALAIQQRRANRRHRVRAGAHITESRHDRVGRAVRLPAHRNDSSIRSTQIIEAGLIG